MRPLRGHLLSLCALPVTRGFISAIRRTQPSGIMASLASSLFDRPGPFAEDGRARVVVIAGPTAVGKSALALELCEELGGELVSADSVQVYRGLDIGSNKASAEEQARVRHHLLDIVDPKDERFTAGRFVRAADAAVDDIVTRGKVRVRARFMREI